MLKLDVLENILFYPQMTQIYADVLNVILKSVFIRENPWLKFETNGVGRTVA
jgi:hypothetical protein